MVSDALCYLAQVDSTNRYAKQRLTDARDLDAVYTLNQTAGRGRLGRSWANAAGEGLYFTISVRRALAQPEALPLLASLAGSTALGKVFGVQVAIKWPNDLLLGGKKLCGILCEGAPDGFVCGMGFNLRQPQAYFDAAALPYGTSLALCGVAVQPADAHRLAAALRAEFATALPTFAQEGFAPLRVQYKSVCVNLGRAVQFDGGNGTATDVDEAGRLVVRTADGETRVFTGEVSVRGVYGQLPGNANGG